MQIFDQIKKIIGDEISEEKLQEIQKLIDDSNKETKFVLKQISDYITEADPDDFASDDSEIGCFIGKSGLRRSIRYGLMRQARDLFSRL